MGRLDKCGCNFDHGIKRVAVCCFGNNREELQTFYESFCRVQTARLMRLLQIMQSRCNAPKRFNSVSCSLHTARKPEPESVGLHINSKAAGSHLAHWCGTDEFGLAGNKLEILQSVLPFDFSVEFLDSSSGPLLLALGAS